MKISHLQTSSSTSIFILLLLLSSPCSSNLQRRRQLLPRPSPPSNSMEEEEKIRLGSTPPSCYNKCNGCHPCMAVQVPTEPIRPHAPLLGRSSGTAAVEFVQPSDEGSRFGNYKPLGWKCRCNNRFFNP